ncbi:MAG: site-specific integrase [Acidimicrobiales bacterium]
MLDDSKALDPSTVKAVHVVLHKAFAAAVKWERLAKNPVDHADPPRVAVEADDMQTWSAEQLRTFLAFSTKSGDRNHALWVLLATTGMRRGEALGLRWQDVDLDAGRLRVVQTIPSINGRTAVSGPKTAHGRRPIALDPSTVAVLREHRRKMLEERMLVGPDHSD